MSHSAQPPLILFANSDMALQNSYYCLPYGLLYVLMCVCVHACRSQNKPRYQSLDASALSLRQHLSLAWSTPCASHWTHCYLIFCLVCLLQFLNSGSQLRHSVLSLICPILETSRRALYSIYQALYFQHLRLHLSSAFLSLCCISPSELVLFVSFSFFYPQPLANLL